jgi:hypothetical protein
VATNKVEIGFDLSGQPDAEFAKLDDAFYGILDAAQTILGGAIYQDVTPDVISYSINRGKSRQLDKYQSGTANIQLDNNLRSYDPLYSASPYSGQILPKREIRITSNSIVQYQGVIDDWDLQYQPEGNSIAIIKASDEMSQMANQSLSAVTNTAQFTGERIAAILGNAGMQWPNNRTDLETGLQSLQADVISEGTNALSYLNTIADSEPGDFYINREGIATFKDRYESAPATPLLFADDGTGIPYQNLAVVYGSELLYNEVSVSRLNGGTETAVNLKSQEDFGISSFSLSGLPLDNETSAENLATYLVSGYAQPEYRFEAIDINITDLSSVVQTQILNLEVTDFIRLLFTPNNVPPAIDRFAKVIRLSQTVTPLSHTVTLGLASTEYNFFTLSDVIFGRLTSGNALSY